jgi:hypothetical protein
MIDDSLNNNLAHSVVHQQKLFMKLVAVQGYENEEFGGFLTKFYTEESGKVYLNFWRMSNYGRYDGAIFRYLIAEFDTCEIPKKLIIKVHHGHGYDFVILNSTGSN